MLQVSNLHISFKTDEGNVTAVHELSFGLKKGESIGIVGESGSGKSVSSLAIMGLLDKRSLHRLEGKILFESEKFGKVNLAETDKETRRKIRGKEIAMIFQEPMTALNPVYRCGKQVLEAVMLHQKIGKTKGKQICLDLFREVQIQEPERIFNSYPHEISGGQRQRVMIAMALAGNPALLIADEPTTALDASVQGAILALLKKISTDRNMSLIFISHDLGVIKKVCDRTLVMYKGRQVEEGETGSLFQNPQHPYTRALLECIPGNNDPHKRLPVLGDFFALDENGNFIEKTPTDREFIPKTQSKEVLLEVKDLSVSYSSGEWWKRGTENEVLKDVDFSLRKGETLGLLGESGSGKSTLGRTLLGLVKRKGGSIFYKGAEVPELNGKTRKAWSKQVQIIFQDPYSSLNPKFRIGDAIEEVMAIHGIGKNQKERKSKVLSLLEQVGLDAKSYNKYPHEFSGGQRQRVSIARCLALEPELIVCDESVSALDVSVQAQVLNLLNDLQSNMGFSCLFITHDIGVVRYFADKVMVLEKGEIVEMKNTAELFSNPEHPYTRKLLEAEVVGRYAGMPDAGK